MRRAAFGVMFKVSADGQKDQSPDFTGSCSINVSHTVCYYCCCCCCGQLESGHEEQRICVRYEATEELHEAFCGNNLTQWEFLLKYCKSTKD